MNRNFQKVVDFVLVNRNSLIGLGIGLWACRRFSNNMTELERNTQEKKLFDPLKAKAQIQVYKDIYKLEGAGEDEAGSRLRIMESAQKDDLKQLNQFFEKQGANKSKDE